MKLVPLFELEFAYTVWEEVGAIVGETGSETQAWGLAEGAVRGERVSGSHRSCNHPRRRTDNVNVPDVHGIIATDDGAKIYYHLDGYGIATHGTRRTIGSARFRTGDARYAWLNTVVAVDEGLFTAMTAPIRFYECVAEET
jgi:hypothetical protein